MRHFVTALLQAARCSGYRAQIPTIVPKFDSHWGCDCVEWKNTEYKERGENIHKAVFFLLQNLALFTVRVGAAMLA